MDARFNDEENRTKADTDFYVAWAQRRKGCRGRA